MAFLVAVLLASGCGGGRGILGKVHTPDGSYVIRKAELVDRFPADCSDECLSEPSQPTIAVWLEPKFEGEGLNLTDFCHAGLISVIEVPLVADGFDGYCAADVVVIERLSGETRRVLLFQGGPFSGELALNRDLVVSVPQNDSISLGTLSEAAPAEVDVDWGRQLVIEVCDSLSGDARYMYRLPSLIRDDSVRWDSGGPIVAGAADRIGVDELEGLFGYQTSIFECLKEVEVAGQLPLEGADHMWVYIALNRDPVVRGWIWVATDAEAATKIPWDAAEVPIVTSEAQAPGLPDLAVIRRERTDEPGEPCYVPGLRVLPEWLVTIRNDAGATGPTSLTLQANDEVRTLQFTRSMSPGEEITIAASGGSNVLLDPLGEVTEADEENNGVQLPPGGELVCR